MSAQPMETKKLKPSEVTVSFVHTENSGLIVRIETPRLLIRSVTERDTDNYFNLFSDFRVMEKYAAGKPITDRSLIENRIKGWVTRWQNKVPDPFNGLAIFKKDKSEFIGHVVIGRSEEGPGISELAYIFHKEFWGQGYGSEAVSAVVNHYAIQIIKKSYKLDGAELRAIIATTRIEHERSNKILKLAGLTTEEDKINEKFGAKRFIYRVDSKRLLEIYMNLCSAESQFFTHQRQNNEPITTDTLSIDENLIGRHTSQK